MIRFLIYIFLLFFPFTSSVNAQVAEDIQRHQQNLIDAGFQKQELDRAIQQTPASTFKYAEPIDIRKIVFDNAANQ